MSKYSKPLTVVEHLASVKYPTQQDMDEGDLGNYVPSMFSLDFINFIKLVNGTQGESHKSPVVHFKMLDTIADGDAKIINMCHRGMAKTTVMGEYLFLYLGVYGELPDFADKQGFGKVDLALYVSDSIENGVKNMRKNLEYRWENSEFLQENIPNVRFTDIRWEFNNTEGNRFIVKGYGAKTGVRGAKEMGKRPQLAVLDDLVSDEDARSATVIETIEATVNKAVNFALDPARNMTIWSGTPFNARDPLYKAVETGAWTVNVFPVCEKFPVPESDFRGSWPDRFPYSYVLAQYDFAVQQGKAKDFNQELMLSIMSDDDRLVTDNNINYYSRTLLSQNRHYYNFYITTDFATSEEEAADYSVISVWAYNNVGDWLWVDGICERQDMGKNVDDLFRLANKYKPQQVGVEVSGQQGGFLPFIRRQMQEKNFYFTLASDNNKGAAGIRPVTNKLARFHVVVPLFKMGKIYYPEEMLGDKVVIEHLTELRLASANGFKSLHDDCIDTISMLSCLTPWKPSVSVPSFTKSGIPDMWDDYEDDDDSALNSYIV